MSRSPDGSNSPRRTAGLFRRLPAIALDALPSSALVAVGFAMGAFDARIFSAPEGWFWSEWIFKYWLDDRAALLAPVAALVGLGIIWTAAWEASTGRSPGARLLRLRIVDRSGRRIRPKHAWLRALGAVLNTATLGLGYLWIIVSRFRRGWHDLVSGAVVIYEP